MNDRMISKEEKDRGHILRLQFAIVCLKELNKEMREEIKRLTEDIKNERKYSEGE